MSKAKKRTVLFLTRRLQQYRIPIFRKVLRNADFDLTIAHAGPALLSPEDKIQEVILNEKSLGPFFIHKQNLVTLCDGFDAVVAMMYLQRLSFMRLLFVPKRSFALLFWGIGVKASVSTKFDEPSPMNFFRKQVMKFSDATIFYTDYARKKYVNSGINPSRLFVMPNTVEVAPIEINEDLKENIIFVGSLYKQKKIFTLLNSYLIALKENEFIPELHIIGDGNEYDSISKWIVSSDLQGRIKLHGAIFEEEILKHHFSRAIATISPGQAGLSVLKSMGYGVPFITRSDAATGGERLSIEHEKNGILYDQDADLPELIKKIAENREYFLELGRSAKHFYDNYRTPDKMAMGFINAVDYAVENRLNKNI